MSQAMGWSGVAGGWARPGAAPFYVGAAIDLTLGLDFLAFADALAQVFLPAHPTVLAIPTPMLLRGLGLLLIAFAAATALFARAPRLRRLLPAVVALNWAWAAMSAALIFAQPPLSSVAVAAVVPAGVLTAALALAQSRALGAAMARP